MLEGKTHCTMLRNDVLRRVVLILILLLALGATTSLSQTPASGFVGCPDSENVIINGSISCVCPVGQYFNNGTCNQHQPRNNDGDPVDVFYDFYFRPSYEIRNFQNKTRLETLFFVTAVILLLIWIMLACSARLLPLGDGNIPGGGLVFRLRWAITRLDRRYHRKHWLDEQKVLTKRRTELGGTCSTASYIFTCGSLLGLTFQEFWSESRLVQSLVANNGREVTDFANYLEWNVSVISGMDCSQLRITNSTIGKGLDLRYYDFIKSGTSSKCIDGPTGPQIVLSCPECRPVSDMYTVFFEFVDMPGKPALATGIEYLFKASETNKSVSRESVAYGALKVNGTLRGPVENVVWFRGIPRYFSDSNNLRLMQATFYDYLGGTTLTTEAELNESLSDASQTVKFVLIMEVLSEYVVQTDKNPYTLYDALAWLAAMGGVYQLGISVFYLLQLQVEIRVRGMAYDEKLMLLAHRVWRRKALWRKAKCRLKCLWVLTHLREYKLKLEEEKKQLLEAMEAQWKTKEAKLAKEEKAQGVGESRKQKAGLYSGFLRRRPRSPEAQQPLVGVPGGVSLASPDGWGRSKPDNKEEELSEVRVEVPSDHRDKEGGSVPESEPLMSAEPQGASEQLAGATAMAPAGQGGSQGVLAAQGDTTRMMRSFSAEDARAQQTAPASGSRPSVAWATGPPRAPQILQSMGGFMHEAATSLGAAAQTVRPRLPHVFSAPLSVLHRSTTGESSAGSETGHPAGADVAQEGTLKTKKKKKRKSKACITYGSNTSYQGMIIREYRKPSWLLGQEHLPAAPNLEDTLDFNNEDDVDWDVIIDHMQQVYKYNLRLRQDFLEFQTMIENTVQFFRPQSDL